jgi:hypothetical protein
MGAIVQMSSAVQCILRFQGLYCMNSGFHWTTFKTRITFINKYALHGGMTRKKAKNRVNEVL